VPCVRKPLRCTAQNDMTELCDTILASLHERAAAKRPALRVLEVTPIQCTVM
jgi:hypothetical protein